jgi:hypothetical protein
MVARAKQRLKGQFPKLVVGHDDEIGYSFKLPSRRLEQQVVETTSRGAKAKIAPGQLPAEAFDQLCQFGLFDGQGKDRRLGLRLALGLEWWT